MLEQIIRPKTATEILDALITLGNDVAADLQEDAYDRLQRWSIHDPKIPGKEFSTIVHEHALEHGFTIEQDYFRQPFWAFSVYQKIDRKTRAWTLDSMTRVSDDKPKHVFAVTYNVPFVMAQSPDHYFTSNWLGKAWAKYKGKIDGRAVVQEMRETVKRNPLNSILQAEDTLFGYKDRIFVQAERPHPNEPRHCIGMGIYDVETRKPHGYVLFRAGMFAAV